jgi:nucleoside-diphosphate-sugar epimerase
MYIDDCVEGTMRITTGDYGEPLNLGSTELVSINRLVDIAEAIAGIKLHRNYNLAAPQGVRGRNSDNTRLLKEIGWEPEVSLEDGLERTYRWIYDELAHGRRDVSEAS